MHRRIAQMIERIVEDSPYTDISCRVDPQRGDGFWSCTITFKNRETAHGMALVKLLTPLGLIYGETLSIDDCDKHVIIN